MPCPSTYDIRKENQRTLFLFAIVVLTISLLITDYRTNRLRAENRRLTTRVTELETVCVGHIHTIQRLERGRSE